jgi:DNA topoisomerase-2
MSDEDSLAGSMLDEGESTDFEPPAKPTAKPTKAVAKSKAAPKKAAGPAKPRARPAGDATKAKPKSKAAPKKKVVKEVSDDENSDVAMDDIPMDDDDSLLADTPPQAKKAPGPKKTSGKPLADIANESFDMDGASELPAVKVKKGGAAADKYQMVSLCVLKGTRPLANFDSAYPSRTHHKATRYLHWLY